MQSTLRNPYRTAVEQCIRDLQAALGEDAVLTRPADLLAYDGDAYPMARQTPAAVALPATTEQTAAAVRLCARYGIPFVPRGAGTGLSGGATPLPDSVVISTARMNRIIATDIPNRRALVEAGCTNISISDAVAAYGLHYAPDPSSQGVCTIGGNIAENAGGPHTLKYGVTVNHVTGLTLVRPSGDVVRLGGMAEEPSGYDLVGLTVGSEGTFGIVTEAIVKLTPVPAAVRTLLAVFDTVEACTRAVVKVLASGVIPCALEMIDRTILMAIEDAFHFGFPREAGAVLTVEIDGPEHGIDDEAAIVRQACMDEGAREVRLAADASDRARLWIARKKGVGTAGRLASSIVTQDGAIPRSKLPEVLAAVAECAQRHGIRVCNIFHAGDGNLHPCVLYDQSDADEAERVHAFNEEVLALCVAAGGTITGEHGVGIEKREAMRLMFSEADLRWMHRIRDVFDPTGLCNPGKLLPPVESLRSLNGERSNGLPPSDGPCELSDHGELLPRSEDDCREAIRSALRERAPIEPRGAGLLVHLAPSCEDQPRVLSTRELRRLGPLCPADNLVTCQAGVTFGELQAAAAEHGQWVPIDPPRADEVTVGGVVAANATALLQARYGRPGDAVVAMRAISATGDTLRTGAHVVKNAAGYDLGRLLAGSHGTLAVITEVTFRTLPKPASTAELAFEHDDLEATCRFAWEIWTSHPELQYVAVSLEGVGRIAVGAGGNDRSVCWLVGTITSAARQHGLREMAASGIAERMRHDLNAMSPGAAVRIAAAPHDAYGIVGQHALSGLSVTWLVGAGVVVVGCPSEDDSQGVAGIGAVARDAAMRDAAVRWLRASSSLRRRWRIPPANVGEAALASELKRALDPYQILSPGRMTQ